jgi:PGF-pre-PGF domain-containing protein
MDSGATRAAAVFTLLALVLPAAHSQTISFDIALDTVPAVSSVSISSLTYSSAVVTWQTSVPADTQAEYGTTTGYGSLTAFDPALVLSHAATITGLLPSTTYHFRLLSADATGLMQPSADQTFTTAPAPATPSNPAPQISGTGSDGGGGSASVSFDTAAASSAPVDTVTLEATTLLSGRPVSLSVPQGFPLKTVKLQSHAETYDVKVTLKKISAANVPSPPGTVYSYVRIDGVNTGGLSSVEVEFDLQRSWLAANGYTPGSVKMLRYSDAAGRWEQLPTYMLSDNPTTYSFKSVLPGFSIFAIVAADNLIIPAVSEEPENTAGESGALAPLVSVNSKIPINMQFFVISGVMFLVALLLYVHYHRRRKDASKITNPFAVGQDAGQN